MYILIHVTSQTEARRIERLLAARGIYAAVRKTPFFISRTGCGYCLRIRPGMLDGAMEAIKRGKASYKAVYEVEGESARRIRP